MLYSTRQGRVRRLISLLRSMLRNPSPIGGRMDIRELSPYLRTDIGAEGADR